MKTAIPLKEESFHLFGLQERQLGLATSGLHHVYRETLEDNLFQLCKEGDHIKLADFLQRQLYSVRVNLNCRDQPYRNTPLMVAGKRGHGTIVRLLVTFGADATLRNLEGQTILDYSSNAIKKVLWELSNKLDETSLVNHFHLAVWFGNRESVDRHLLRPDGSLHHPTTWRNEDGFHALTLAVRDLRLFENFSRQSRLDYSPQSVVLSLLGAGYCCNELDPLHMTPLHWCAINVCESSVQVLTMLLDRCIFDKNSVDKCGYTVVHSAARHGNSSVLELLLQRGFSANVQGKAGATPLHLSAMGGYENCVLILLNYKADVTVRDTDGQRAVDAAKTNRIRQLLHGTPMNRSHSDKGARPTSSPSTIPWHPEKVESQPTFHSSIKPRKTSASVENSTFSHPPINEETMTAKSLSPVHRNKEDQQYSNFFTNRGLEKAKKLEEHEFPPFSHGSKSPMSQSNIIEKFPDLLFKGRVSSRTFVQDVEETDIIKSPTRLYKEDISLPPTATQSDIKTKIIVKNKAKVKKESEKIGAAITRTPASMSSNKLSSAQEGASNKTQKSAVIRKKSQTSTTSSTSGKKKSVIVKKNRNSQEVVEEKHPDLKCDAASDDEIHADETNIQGVNDSSQVVHISGIGWRFSTALNLNDPSITLPCVHEESSSVNVALSSYRIPTFYHEDDDDDMTIVGELEYDPNSTELPFKPPLLVDQSTNINMLFCEHEDHNEYDLEGWKRGNLLGHGAYGMVYLGMTRKGQLIAVKEVGVSFESESEILKIQEELEILKTLKHKHIVNYLGTARKDEIVQIFMEYIPGGSIAALINKFGPLEENIIQRFTHQVVDGIIFLHTNHVIHRDIKGANLMLNPNGVIKIIDFGCAKRLLQHHSQNGTTILQKSLKGSPYWMAPEVILETGHGKKSDVWSIGCTVFEMATGKPPWIHLNKFAAIFAIGSATEEIPGLRSPPFSNAASNFVRACMTREILHRPTSIELLKHPFLCFSSAHSTCDED